MFIGLTAAFVVGVITGVKAKAYNVSVENKPKGYKEPRYSDSTQNVVFNNCGICGTLYTDKVEEYIKMIKLERYGNCNVCNHDMMPDILMSNLANNIRAQLETAKDKLEMAKNAYGYEPKKKEPQAKPEEKKQAPKLKIVKDEEPKEDKPNKKNKQKE